MGKMPVGPVAADARATVRGVAGLVGSDDEADDGSEDGPNDGSGLLLYLPLPFLWSVIVSGSFSQSFIVVFIGT